MLGNSHVRFGERDGETCLGDGVKRLVPTPPATVGFGQGVIGEMLYGLLDVHQSRFGAGLTPDYGDDGDSFFRQGHIRTGHVPRLNALDLAAVATTIEGHSDGCDPGTGEGGKDRSLIGGPQVRARCVLCGDLRHDIRHRDGQDHERLVFSFVIGRLIGHECSPERKIPARLARPGRQGCWKEGIRGQSVCRRLRREAGMRLV